MALYAIMRGLVASDVRVFAAPVGFACKLSCTKSCHLSDWVSEVAAGS